MTEYRIALKNIYISFIVNAFSFFVTFVSIYITNQYLGTTNYGLLNIAIAFVPYITLLTSSIETITIYRLYEPLSKKNYELANRLMQRSLYEYRTRGVISFTGLLIMSAIFPIIIGTSDLIDGVINGLIILAAGLSSLFSFVFSPIYQRVLTVERKGYILQIFDLIGKFLFNGIFIIIVITNAHYGYISNNKWLLVISAFVSNLVGSFSVFIAFGLRKKIAWWFVPKTLRDEVGDQMLRRQILIDGILGQLVLNTSFFVFAIYSNFSPNSFTLAGIYANYFLVKSAVSSLLSVVVNAPGSSYARIYHTGSDVSKLNAFQAYDYLAFIIALISMFFVLFGSPFITSFVISKPAENMVTNINVVADAPTPDQLLSNSFNVWISLIVSLSCFIGIARNSTENYKNITGEYRWKLKFAIYETIINIWVAITSTIIAYYFPNLLNGLFLIFGLILGTVLSTGFRYIALKISVAKSFYKDKTDLRKELLRIFLLEVCPILALSVIFTLTLDLLIGNTKIDLNLNGQGILTLFLIFLVAVSVIMILTTIFIVINPEFRHLTAIKIKELMQYFKNKKQVKKN